MALSDYLTGKNPFEESDDATVATVATGKGGTPIKQKESVYIKSSNPFISDTKTLRHFCNTWVLAQIFPALKLSQAVATLLRHCRQLNV